MAHCRPARDASSAPPPHTHTHMYLRGTVKIPSSRVHSRYGTSCMQHPHPKFYCMLFRFPPPAFPAVCAAVTPAYHARVCMIVHGGLNVFLVLGMHAALRFVLVSTAVQASGPATAFSSSAVDLKRLSLADRQGQVRAPAQLRLMTRTGLRLAQRKAETGAVQKQAHDFPTPSRVPPHHYTPTTILCLCPARVMSPGGAFDSSGRMWHTGAAYFTPCRDLCGAGLGISAE